MANGILILICCCFCVLQVAAVDQENFYPFGEGAGDNYLRKENDVAGVINLNWSIPFYNHKYWKIFVNDNGILSFGNQYTEYEGPQPVFPIGPDLEETTEQKRILIAPFWANVDMTDVGYVYYRQTTDQDLLDRASADVHKSFVEWDDFQAKVLIIATWFEVGFFGLQYGINLRNYFQCIIASDEFETFAIYIYDQIDWTTGVESHGGADNGIGGVPAQVGFNAGDGFKSFSHRYSRDSIFLKTNLVHESNIDVPGVWVYSIGSNVVDTAGCTSAGEVKTFPRYDSMLGHRLLYIGGPCFNPEDAIWIQFGPADDPVALTNCTWISTQRAWCVVPTFYQVGRIETRVSTDDAITFPYTGTFDIVPVGSDGPPGIKRIDPHSESWMLANRPVAIEWDPGLIDFTQISIDILTYSETDVLTNWDETENIAFNVENTGHYEWTPSANSKITIENAVGVIRISGPYESERDQVAIWSDVHWLGYMMNDEFQSDPAIYSNQQCELWNERMLDEPTWDFDKDLKPCPLDISQAMADRAHFRPLDMCDMSMAGEDNDEDYCFFREGIKHCVINIINSPQNADSVCCYDYEENLVSATDRIYGSFSHRHTIYGVPPYDAPKAVPVMSTWIHDIVPYYTCCVMGDICEYYQVHRPTRASRWRDESRMAVAFGDPHFVTFDGTEYTFNGKGEWTFMRTVSDAPSRFILQGRTEQMLDWEGNLVDATRVSSVAMKEDDRSNIEIQLSSRTVLQVVYQGNNLKIDRQTWLPMDGFYLTFPRDYEDGNITQVIITFQNSGIGVVVNGTAEGMFIQVVVPNELKGHVEGLMSNWDGFSFNDLKSSDGITIADPNRPESVYTFGKSWEINIMDSLFLYDQGKNHDYYQDNNFVPIFDPPECQLPPYLNTQNITDTCDGNKFCIFDTQSTGILQLGKATKKAYDDYKEARRALQDKRLSITPDHGGMMGGELIYLHGPCAEVGRFIDYKCVFTYDGEIIQEVNAAISDDNETYNCVPDPFFLVGEVRISVILRGDDLEGSPTAIYSISKYTQNHFSVVEEGNFT